MSDAPIDTAVSQGSDVEFNVQGQVVLILCGLIASGKSTFAQSLQDHLPQFRRCNQDDLGDRRRVEQLARQSLAEGESVCVDRTNFDSVQRSHWIKIAREFPGTEIWVIVFDTPYETCAARLRCRTGHPTITTPEQGLNVLERFAADFRPPQPYEGYNHILHLTPSDHDSPLYSRDDIVRILKQVQDSPRVVSNTNIGHLNNPYSGYFPSQGDSYRGSWRGLRGSPVGFIPRGRGSNFNIGPLANTSDWRSAVGWHGESRRGWGDKPDARRSLANSTQSEIGNTYIGSETVERPFKTD